MTDIQKRFVEEYCKDCKGGPAAIRAGYSKEGARQKAYELKQDPEIAEAINLRLLAMSMSAEEAQRHVSDIAATRLNDYLTVETVWESSYEKRSLKDLIKELETENQIDSELMARTEMPDKTMDEMFVEIQKRKLQIIRYEIELEINPRAHRVMKTEPKPVKRASVDLVALAKADNEGRIKKLSFNERGLPSVECYPADAALETILKLHGKLVQKIDHSGDIGVKTVDTSTLSDEEKKAFLLLARRVK